MESDRPVGGDAQTCDECGVVYDAIQCPVCGNKSQLERIKDWIRGQES